ncbi:phage tail fiber assembly protein [Variovorax sp. WDL1]|nr:phage tail fiber assembly protein [Variovorax sp. WDL1]
MEIIEPFLTTEEMRPQPPFPWPEGYQPGAQEQHAWEEAQAAHDNFHIGEVPIEQRFSPEILATLVAIPEGVQVLQGESYSEASGFGPPPPTPPVPPPTEEQVIAQRDALLALAAIRIAPLQDAVDLGDASPAEEAALVAWKQYRVKLNRINQQPGYPGSVTWPEAPQ